MVRAAEQVMDYVLLSPGEAAILLGVDPGEIVRLVESGELGGLRVAGQWRVPLKSITRMLAVGMPSQSVSALALVFEDHARWQRVFGAHPEVTQQLEAGEFPHGSVGAYLKEAVANARLQRGGVPAPTPEEAALPGETSDDEGG
jgi:excisionase family DNA binding protein